MSTARLVLTGLLALLIGGAFVHSLVSEQAAPDIVFSTLKGEKIALEALRGKVVLVNFWATTCAACVREMPGMIDTYHRYRNKGFEILAVAMPYDPPNYVLKFTHDRQLPFPVALDIRGEAVRAFGNVNLTPTSFLIGKDGLILEKKTGELDFAGLKATLDKHLGV
ncbi:MAG: TlpA family protein disulfide reductase [Hydrogenophilaceae bacterium]|nr:TlpA family protein disulfide reductase [Hydrogenophilaceae bacterium]